MLHCISNSILDTVIEFLRFPVAEYMDIQLMPLCYKYTITTIIIIITIIINLCNIPGQHEVKELQQTAVLGTAHILREVLM
jgi:hypothetical protein